MNGYMLPSQRPNTATTLSVIHSNTKIVCATMKRPVSKQAGESLGEAARRRPGRRPGRPGCRGGC